ncbi:MAG TPA: NUDIX domain-containing protein [Terriglobales bacterium]|nr:NUDIX domain-containing protein [Terriglobales bacterium]
MSIPTFGKPVPGVTYKQRPSAYAVVMSGGKIAIARTPLACYLPGGGIDAGETPEDTVRREAAEECGFLLSPQRFLGDAIEICYAEDEHQYFEKHSAFFAASIVGSATKTEADHELLWLSPKEAIAVLSHGSHRWAVQQLLSGPNPAEC